jgi:OPA family glycerol-3-phosphate transporter-like MFS transporter
MPAAAPAPLRNPVAADGRVVHPGEYRRRRALNWVPLGIGYAMLYMGRYNLTVAQGALGGLMPKESFGTIFGVGAVVYGCAFLLNGPLTDRFGGRRAMLLALFGAFAANVAMGTYVRAITLGGGASAASVTRVMSVLYAVNMYFQSYGAVAIVKVNASWFHVRERGGFSGVFGIMIASGIYFAFDVNERLLRLAHPATPAGGVVASWIVFFAPAAALFTMFLLEMFLLRDGPASAGHFDIDTGDASAGEDAARVPTGALLRRILTNPVIMTVAAIEFCTGVLRDGVMHWFRIYAGEQAKAAAALGAAAPAGAHGWDFALANLGLLSMFAGILGGNTAGLVSDKLFGSRRAPAAFLMYAILISCLGLMVFSLDESSRLTAIVFFISLAVIGTHGVLSGTATMDFGGRKGAATAVGVIDGFVYLGTAVQSLALGRITSRPGGWRYWPIFLLPFAALGIALLTRIWHAMPKGKRAH